MADLKGTNVAAPIVPFTTDDKYATHDAEYGKGGYRSIGTIALRDAIPADRKAEGMIVRVQADKKEYVWEGGAWKIWKPASVDVPTKLSQLTEDDASRHYTKGEKDKLAGIEANATRVTVDAALSPTSMNPVQNKIIKAAIDACNTSIGGVSGQVSGLTPKVDALVADNTTNKNNIGTLQTQLGPIKTAWDKRNGANGLAQVDGSGKLPASLLPAGYDNIDMLENFVTTNPSAGMTAGQKWYNSATKKILKAVSATAVVISDPIGDDLVYINKSTNKSYRWTGADMTVIGDGSGVALGTTASTAFRADYGYVLYNEYGVAARKAEYQKAYDFFRNIGVPSNAPYIKGMAIREGDVTPDAVHLHYDIGYYTGADQDSDSVDIPAATSLRAGVMTADMFKALQEIELATFPLELTLSGGGTFETGSGTTNAISIVVKKKGVDITSSSTIAVTSSPNIAGTLSSDKKTWTPSASIRANTTVTVKATYGSQTITKTVDYTFKFKKYWGESSKATLANADILALGGSTWADSKDMPPTNFYCTGGKYPYYVVPLALYPVDFWVGGLKNTDVISESIIVTNASGGISGYMVLRLANIQTGLLTIDFK